MIEETDFETFLYICKNKYQLFVYDKINLINIYNEEIKISDETEPNNLSKFLDINVYKIEKMIKNFITNITIIIEDDKVLDVAISIKKKYEKNIDQKHLENSLLEVQDVFRQNHQDQIIMHMIIVNNDTKETHSCKPLSFNPRTNYSEVGVILLSDLISKEGPGIYIIIACRNFE